MLNIKISDALKKIFYRNKAQHTYDLYIPFGRSCHCTMMLKNLNLRTCSMPFDWIIPYDYSIEPISERFALLENFELFFNKQDFSFYRDKVTCSGHYTVINNKYKFEIGHDFDINLSNEENLEKLKEKFIRRWQRMLEYIEKSDKVCFVYMVNTWTQNCATSHLDLDIVKENLDKLQKKFTNTQFNFIIFEHNAKMKRKRIKEEKITENITGYLSNHSYQANSEPLSDIISINKILSSYHLSNKFLNENQED